MTECFLPSWSLGRGFSEEEILDLGSESEVCHADEIKKAEGVECAEIQ